jgi:hypothetical protein
VELYLHFPIRLHGVTLKHRDNCTFTYGQYMGGKRRGDTNGALTEGYKKPSSPVLFISVCRDVVSNAQSIRRQLCKETVLLTLFQIRFVLNF